MTPVTYHTYSKLTKCFLFTVFEEQRWLWEVQEVLWWHLQYLGHFVSCWYDPQCVCVCCLSSITVNYISPLHLQDIQLCTQSMIFSSANIPLKIFGYEGLYPASIWYDKWQPLPNLDNQLSKMYVALMSLQCFKLCFSGAEPERLECDLQTQRDLWFDRLLCGLALLLHLSHWCRSHQGILVQKMVAFWRAWGSGSLTWLCRPCGVPWRQAEWLYNENLRPETRPSTDSGFEQIKQTKGDILEHLVSSL